MGLHDRKYWRPDSIASFASHVGTMQTMIVAQAKQIRDLKERGKQQTIAYADLLKKYEKLKREAKHT